MPASAESSRVFATTSFSCSRPIVANTGAVWLEATVGLALCATTQIEHDDDSAWLG